MLLLSVLCLVAHVTCLPAPCTDSDTGCSEYLANGDNCAARWMAQNCMKTCGVCYGAPEPRPQEENIAELRESVQAAETRAKIAEETLNGLLARMATLPSYANDDCEEEDLTPEQHAKNCKIFPAAKMPNADAAVMLYIECFYPSCNNSTHGVASHVFHVVATGPTLVEGDVAPMGNGLYMVALDLTHPGAYSITAHIRMLSGKWQLICTEDIGWEKAGRVWEEIANSPMSINVHGSDPPSYETLPICSGFSNKGQWVRVPGVETGGTVESWHDDWQWQGRQCRYKHYTPAEARKCLQHRRLVVVGDSQSRMSYVTLQNIFFSEMTNAGKKFQHDASQCRDGICVDFHWLRYPDEILSHFKAQDDNLQCADAIIVQSGQWNAANRCIKDAHNDYRALAEVMKRHGMIWATVPAASRDIAEDNWLTESNSRQSAPRVWAENRQSSRIMEHHGVPQLDLHSMTRPRLDTICDQSHYACARDKTVSALSEGDDGNTALDTGAPVLFSYWQVVFNGLCNEPQKDMPPIHSAEACRRAEGVYETGDIKGEFDPKLEPETAVGTRQNISTAA